MPFSSGKSGNTSLYANGVFADDLAAMIAGRQHTA